ncbi:hypothetical protein LOZ61_002196 [Ophidiomyces ophidiicola]|nr:hypothetical protein LOZ61_002196 [Ophidiomyces ophidiicola]KAI2148227.1 hypothetical protein LOZ27_001889 [Ophidiomyces ophidiicola]KAI2264388.1 hypothetical protein LOZ10_002817 [Ophidiomyces ophidiicola]KAI2421991.1 hypothetical protein LOZ30_006390 [Ophidiomyces ophidiicola]KAI2431561.1 hypothetical protein LOZ19_006255 [Ophidiomyces ophidiicola]
MPLSNATVAITDIRRNDLINSLAEGILQGLEAKDGVQKCLPTLLLYNAEGLRLFEEITYLEDYYLTNAEIDVLTTNATNIVERAPENAQLLELGSGNLRKIEILLNEFERKKKSVEYLALDVSLEELQRTFAEIPSKSYKYVKCGGLLGTYDDALTWLRQSENRRKPTWIMSLGSSIGNFSRSEAAHFLSGFAKTLGPEDSLLIGLDSCKNPQKVFRAYNDRKNVTREFYLNGLANANSILGSEAFKRDEWDVIGVYHEEDGCHKAYYTPTKNVVINGLPLEKGERIFFEQAFKYDRQEYDSLWEQSGVTPTARFNGSAGNYNIHLLSSSPYIIPTQPAEYAPTLTPSLKSYEALWKLWDTVTTEMVPQNELLSKPISLRNALVFYLGHIPVFLDTHICNATGCKPAEPKSYATMFERGIDPDVDNPAKCHAHSEIPSQWPPIQDILQFQTTVRNKVRALFANLQGANDRRIHEALWIGFEHEAMHLETFLYMLLQSDRIRPPPGVPRPDFEYLAIRSSQESVPNEWFIIPEQTITIGLDDPDPSQIPPQSFAWDNEQPSRVANVTSFMAKGRPITNGEYSKYLESKGVRTSPASWIKQTDTAMKSGNQTTGYTNGTNHNESSASLDYIKKFCVRTVFGPVPLRFALDWPVLASYDELNGYAQWVNCRIPTLEEARSIYQYSTFLRYQGLEEKSQHSNMAHTNGANVHQNGKPRAPDHQPVLQNSVRPPPVYLDLDGYNVGFKHWHPTPVTQNGNKLSGQGDMGGVWEWTSSALEVYEGFKAMDLYPAYTADFFDGKHNIILGGSWATHPRIAGRTTFVNWYQRNYPYVWAGARLVRDA